MPPEIGDVGATVVRLPPLPVVVSVSPVTRLIWYCWLGSSWMNQPWVASCAELVEYGMFTPVPTAKPLRLTKSEVTVVKLMAGTGNCQYAREGSLVGTVY